jgi:hypothetical protein
MVLWAIVLAGCADWTPPPPAADANGPYALDSGDKLRTIYRHAALDVLSYRLGPICRFGGADDELDVSD